MLVLPREKLVVLPNQDSVEEVPSFDGETAICRAVISRLLYSCVINFVNGKDLVSIPVNHHCIAELHYATRACDQISELIHCLKTHLNPHALHSAVPPFLACPLRNIIVGE